MEISTITEYRAVGEFADGTERQRRGSDLRTALQGAEMAKPEGVGPLRVEARNVTTQTGSWHRV